MGIPAYFSHIIKDYRSIIEKLHHLKKNVDIFALDSNSIVYDCVHQFPWDSAIISRQDYERDLIKRVCLKIKEYMNIIRPKQHIIIALDGVAPFAKMNQQKSRRMKSEIEKNEMCNHGKTWNTSAITPGTAFMNSLGNGLRGFFSKNKHVIVMDSAVAGEGEHKIFQWLRNSDEAHQKTMVVYGLDSDLIMLALEHLSYCPNLYLFRETPHFIRSIDNTLDPNSSYLLNIPEFANILQEKLGPNRIKDYIFLSFFLGNDFIPHSPSLNIRTHGIDVLWGIYKEVLGPKDFLVDKENDIQWKNVRKLLQSLADQEESLLNKELELRNKWERRANSQGKGQGKSDPNNKEDEVARRFQSIPLLHREKELFFHGVLKDNMDMEPQVQHDCHWEHLYYNFFFGFDVTGSNLNDQRKAAGIHYLQALTWTFKYYVKGCPDWRWHYKFMYTPLWKDILSVTPYFTTDLLNNSGQYKDIPVNPITQLSYVLPKSCWNLIPQNNKLVEVLEKLESASHYTHEWSFCKYFWESHIHQDICIPSWTIGNLETEIIAALCY
jgi:5'-3' exonuclease